MEKKHLIWITAGVVVAVLIIASRKKTIPEPVSVIKPGDKGNEVYGLQSVLSSITKLTFPNPGAYDNNTLNAVQYYLKDTNALVDYENGYVNKSFAADLYLLQSKVSKS